MSAGLDEIALLAVRAAIVRDIARENLLDEVTCSALDAAVTSLQAAVGSLTVLEHRKVVETAIGHGAVDELQQRLASDRRARGQAES